MTVGNRDEMSFFRGEQLIKYGRRKGKKQGSEGWKKGKVKDKHDRKRTDKGWAGEVRTRGWREEEEGEAGKGGWVRKQVREEERTRVNGDRCRGELRKESRRWGKGESGEKNNGQRKTVRRKNLFLYILKWRWWKKMHPFMCITATNIIWCRASLTFAV